MDTIWLAEQSQASGSYHSQHNAVGLADKVALPNQAFAANASYPLG